MFLALKAVFSATTRVSVPSVTLDLLSTAKRTVLHVLGIVSTVTLPGLISVLYSVKKDSIWIMDSVRSVEKNVRSVLQQIIAPNARLDLL